jgi:nitronate monooxygenase
MSVWPHRIQDLLGIELPIIQAPMAGSALAEMTIAVSEAGALGSLACALLSAEQLRQQLDEIRRGTKRPVNLNFFCHQPPKVDRERELKWKTRLEDYYAELGIDPNEPVPGASRAPFDAGACEVVERFRPEVVSFHFGLPAPELLARVKATGAKVLSSATSVDEAVWLESRGCDALIAQGAEAGGHRGVFLTEDVSTQVGTIALVPQIVDAVKAPVIAAGGIGDARGIVAAFALGASAVQLGTAYLFCPEAKISAAHRNALRAAKDNATALTNVFTGRPARGIVNRFMHEVGPICDDAPAFPLAGAAVAPLRSKSEAIGSEDFIPLWSGQAARLGRELPANELTKTLAAEAPLPACRPLGDRLRLFCRQRGKASYSVTGKYPVFCKPTLLHLQRVGDIREGTWDRFFIKRIEIVNLENRPRLIYVGNRERQRSVLHPESGTFRLPHDKKHAAVRLEILAKH